MEALNKESEFAAPVLTWAQKRSDLREKSTVGKFVRSSLQGLNHEDVLLKLETKIINNGKGHARASRHLPIVLVKVAYYAEGGVRGVRIPQYRTR